MKFTVSRSSPRSFKADIISIGLYERPALEGETKKKPALIKLADGGIALDRALGGSISKQIAAEKFMGEKGTHRMLFTAGKIPAKFILLTGLGPRDKCDLNILREAGGMMAKAAANVKASSVALVLERGPLGEDTAPDRARAIAEGVILGNYEFKRYRSGAAKESVAYASTTFLYEGDLKSVREAIAKAEIGANATNLCRDLVNTPAKDMTPAILAKEAKKVAAKNGLVCKVLAGGAIKKARFSGLLEISKGSDEPPTFITLTYRPKERPRAKVALVGKAVTFDSGGIAIKPSRDMYIMKGDMAGGAAVIAAMQAIAKLKPPVEVRAYIPATENMPSGHAVRPGDIYTARNGKTVEVINPDAEGRLIMADALSYAADQRPDALIDVATLTGAARYALGEIYSIALGNDQKLVDRLLKASEVTGEPAWQLPLAQAYKKGLKSNTADLKNSGGSQAGTINGALFLSEFVGEAPWVHVDIAANFWSEEETVLTKKGATGAFVRTLVALICSFKKPVTE